MVVTSTFLSCNSSSYKKEQFADLNQSLYEVFSESELPGIAIGIVMEGKVVYASAFGFADMEDEVAATTQTVFQIGSVTKMFTGYVLASLIHQGKILLSDTLSKYFPDSIRFPVSPDGREITVKDIATYIIDNKK